MSGMLRFSKMWSACARARFCPFPENIKGACYRSLNVMADSVCVCVCVSVCVRLCCASYPTLADAARAGRGGAGRFSRMRSGQLTGRRPVHWRGEKKKGKKWNNGG